MKLNKLISNSLILLQSDQNYFLDLSSLKNGKFINLLALQLSKLNFNIGNCNLVEVDTLTSIDIPNLNFLDLSCNHIESIEFLTYCYWIKL